MMIVHRKLSKVLKGVLVRSLRLIISAQQMEDWTLR